MDVGGKKSILGSSVLFRRRTVRQVGRMKGGVILASFFRSRQQIPIFLSDEALVLCLNLTQQVKRRMFTLPYVTSKLYHTTVQADSANTVYIAYRQAVSIKEEPIQGFTLRIFTYGKIAYDGCSVLVAVKNKKKGLKSSVEVTQQEKAVQNQFWVMTP